MRRSFRLATVFTGVAALAGGFGPTAFAATAKPAIQPDIAWQECGANNGGISNWVHLYYPNDDHPAECFHDTGAHSVNATVASFCAGNNYGVFSTSVNGLAGSLPVNFHAGSPRHKIGPVGISIIDIQGWTGDAKCG